MTTKIDLQIFPDEIWATILAFTLETKKEYGVITTTSTQISEVAFNHLGLFNPEIALAFIKTYPKKFDLLPFVLKKSPQFVIATLSKTALSWSNVIHFSTHTQWPHLIKCTVASAKYHNAEILNEKLPEEITQSETHKALIPTTEARIDRLNSDSATETDLDECSEIEAKRIYPDSMRRHANHGWGMSNKAFVMELLQLPLTTDEEIYGAYWLKDISPELKKDKQITLQALKQDGRALQYADTTTKSDRKAVLQAISSDVNAFEFASHDLRKDEEIILPALRKATTTNAPLDFLKFADKTAFERKGFVIQLLQISGNVYSYLPSHLQKESDIITMTLQSPHSYEIGDTICTNNPYNKRIILEAVQKHPKLITTLNDEMKSDTKIIAAAVTRNPKLISEVENTIRNDREFIIQLIKSNPDIYKNLSSDIQNDPMIALEWLAL